MQSKTLLFLFFLFLLFSCGSKDKALNKEIQKKSFSNPFQGTIEAEEFDGSTIFKKTIRYAVSKNFIKRESVLLKILNEKEINRIICDLKLNEVILYRVYGNKKYYVKLKTEEYLVLRESLVVSSSITNNFLKSFPFGTIFFDLPKKEEYSIVNSVIEVNSYICKKSELKHLNIHLIVDHCEEIIVDRNLLELVEMGYPEKITGMAINVLKKYSAVKSQDKVDDKDNLGKIINKAEVIASKIKSALNFKYSIKEIIEKEIDEMEFKLDGEFIESKSFNEMVESTKTEGSGDIDWD